jgi:hypothetical protein
MSELKMRELIIDDYIRSANMADHERISSLAINHKTSEISVRVIISNAKESGLYDRRLQVVAKEKATKSRQQVMRKSGGRR